MRYLFLVGGIFVLIFNACVSLKEPVFNGISNWQMNKIEKGKPVMALQIDCFNPNKKSGKLKDASGEAWMDSTFLGHFHVDSLVDIPANSSFSVPVLIVLETKNLLANSIPFLLNSPVLIRIKGTAKVGKGRFYKNIPLQYEGMQNMRDLFK